jgi:hypothetical protein
MTTYWVRRDQQPQRIGGISEANHESKVTGEEKVPVPTPLKASRRSRGNRRTKQIKNETATQVSAKGVRVVKSSNPGVVDASNRYAANHLCDCGVLFRALNKKWKQCFECFLGAKALRKQRQAKASEYEGSLKEYVIYPLKNKNKKKDKKSKDDEDWEALEARLRALQNPHIMPVTTGPSLNPCTANLWDVCEGLANHPYDVCKSCHKAGHKVSRPNTKDKVVKNKTTNLRAIASMQHSICQGCNVEFNNPGDWSFCNKCFKGKQVEVKSVSKQFVKKAAPNKNNQHNKKVVKAPKSAKGVEVKHNKRPQKVVIKQQKQPSHAPKWIVKGANQAANKQNNEAAARKRVAKKRADGQKKKNRSAAPKSSRPKELDGPWNQDRRFLGKNKRWDDHYEYLRENFPDVEDECPPYTQSQPQLPRLSYRLTEAELNYFRTIFGPIENGNENHDHALAASVRWHAQKGCEEYLTSRNVKILDCWGSARLAHDNKWSTMPIVTPHDSQRIRPNNVCNCSDPSECYCCVVHFGVTNIAPLLVDVIYYLTDIQISKMINRFGMIYTLHHSLHNSIGTELVGTYNYYKYNVGGIGKVHCEVGTGNAKHTYEHNDLAHLYNGPFTYEMIRTYGPMEFGVLLPKQLSAKCVKPRDTVYEALKAIGLDFMRLKDADMATEKDLNSRFKRAASSPPFNKLKETFPEQYYNLQERVALETITNTQVREQGAKVVNAKAWYIERSNDLQRNRFIDLPWYKKHKKAIIACTTILGLGAAKRVAPAGIKDWMVKNPMSVWGNLFQPDVCIHTDFDVHPSTHPIRPRGGYAVGNSIYLQRTTDTNLYLEPSIMLNYDGECGCKDPANRQRGVLLLSYVKGHKPFTFAPCESNICHGLRLRFMRELPSINSGAWCELEIKIKNVLLEFSNAPFVSHKGFFNKWKAKFPLPKQARMQAAKDEPIVEGMFASSACCKYENGFYKEPLKPRVFFPKADSNLVRNGPLMNLIKIKIGRLFNGVKTPFIFGPGNTARSLGAKFTRAVNKYLPFDFTCVELDLSMCETTMRGPFLLIERDIYHAMGIKRDDIDFLLNHKYSYGKSTKGNLSWRMPFCRESGTANTTVGNTVVFAAVLWSFLKLYNINFVCLIGGDDACVYLPRNQVETFRNVVSRISACGLKPEAVYHKHPFEGRFFAGRMMKVRLINTCKHVWAHVPLIGRCIAKGLCCKYTYGQKYDTWLRETTTGHIYDWEHVPCLSVVNRTIRSQFTHVVGRCTIEIPYRDIQTTRLTFGMSDLLYEQLALVYNIDREDIISLEKYLRQHFSGNWVGKGIEHEVLEIMCDIDLK